mgnify:FL=1
MWDSVKQYVLSPQSDLDKVRRYLAAHGFAIEDEAMVKDEGKYYTVMSVKGASWSMRARPITFTERF